MKRIRMPMHRYGDPDFDREYLTWGFHDTETQIQEAESILRLVPSGQSLTILDLACGTGIHAVHWVERGHRVTAIDLSETFIAAAKKRAIERGVEVNFAVHDVTTLDYHDAFDVVTWIEYAFFKEQIIGNVLRFLHKDGYFICDVRNPDHPKTKQREGNWRTWREEDEVFYLERHETDGETGEHEDVWITIDPHAHLITEKFGRSKHLTTEEKIRIIKRAGFSHVELRTMDGASFAYGEEPYWLWVVGRA